MPTFGQFVIFTAFGLILLVYFLIRTKIPYSKKYELTTLAVIALYRISTYLFLFLGGNFGSHADAVAIIDHKWIGLVIVISVLLFWPAKKVREARAVFLGLGTAMIIDEISEVLTLFGVKFTAHFRDSFYDLLLIIATFILFIFLRRVVVKKDS